MKAPDVPLAAQPTDGESTTTGSADAGGPLPVEGAETHFGGLIHSSAFWISLVVVGLVIVFGAITPNNVFIKPTNLLTIGLNASQIILLAVGMTFLIAAGQLDLSVGFSLILSSVLAAKTMVAIGGPLDQVSAGDYPNLIPAIIAGVVVAIGSAASFGLINGLLVTRLRLNSFIATLATSGIFYGIALIFTSAANVPFLPDELQTYFGSNRLFGLFPVPLLLTAFICVLLWWTMDKTRFGVRTVAIGSEREAAVRAGIAVDAHIVKLFVLMGVLVGVAAVIDLARNASTNVVGHQTDNLQAIAAVVLGGTSLFGGIASVGGTILGSLIPVMMANGLVILNVQPFYQLVVVGSILIVAVYLDQRRRLGST